MPHPALPPGPSIPLTAPSTEQVSRSSIPPLVASPEVLPVQFSSSKSQKPQPVQAVGQSGIGNVSSFVQASGAARASALGANSITGYLQSVSSQPQSAPNLTVAKTDATAGRKSADKGNVLAGTRTSADTTYSLSGAQGRGSSSQEALVMDGLNQAIAIDKLPQDLNYPNVWLKTNRLQFDLRAQNDPLNPFLLPVPTQPRPLNDNSGPVFSFPSTLPGQKRPTAPAPNSSTTRVIELTADRQEYDQERQIFIAEGKVSMRYQGGLLDADRVQVNLTNRIALAEGNVAFTRGTQVLRGQRLEYNFVQGVGSIQKARGEIFVPELSSAFETTLPSDTGAAPVLGRPASDRLTSKQPVSNVSSPGSLSVNLGFGRDVNRVPGAAPGGGKIRRLRFEAEQIDFTATGWVAQKIQITNDPFSPPQLILKADRATLTRLSPTADELRASRPRLVFDQKVTLPIPLNRTVISRGEQQPPLVQFGFDSEDRGGLFIQRPFQIVASERFQFSLAPQIFIQRLLLDTQDVGNLDNYGLVGRLNYLASPTTRIRAFAALTSLDVNKFENNLRASVRASQLIGNHSLSLEYSYRDRLFNGSLGFQTVQSSLGALLLSPFIPLGNTGITLRYQAGFQFINSATDRADLLPTNPENSRIDLGRFQASASLQRTIYLWQGRSLPATPDAGLRYTPNPILPYVALGLGLTGVTSRYTSGDSQNNLIGSVALYGQFGHFSRPFFDYTGFSVTYIQIATRGQSPFLFDRTVDNRTLIASLTQQIYGPLRFTIQSSINLDTRQQISTDYILEISRRAYGIILRYNPILEIGSISLRVSDFNWTGGTQAFDGTDITPVEGGIRRERY